MPGDELAAVRARARDQLLAANADGSLEMSLNRRAPSYPDEMYSEDMMKAKARNMLLQANSDGTLEDTLDRRCLEARAATVQARRIDELRMGARARLSAANRDGTLE